MGVADVSVAGAYGQSERSHLESCIHAVPSGAGNELETRRSGRGLPIDDLAARVAEQVAESVRRSDVPAPSRLEKLLGWHVDRGEVELVDGEWRLTPMGRRRFEGLLEPRRLSAAA